MKTLSTLVLSSGDLIADRRFAWAKDCGAKGDLAGAAELLQQALELAPTYASAWFALGEVREKLGDRPGAIDAFRQAREADPEDRHGALLHLIRLGAADTSDMPPAYVRSLFDQYAPAFDHAVTKGLNYNAPGVLTTAVEAACRALRRPRHFSGMLDLGCGTGLAGSAFRSRVGHLTGVDLSPRMIEAAREKHLYDRLEPADVLRFLETESTAGRRYDLIVAADVFVYLPDLAPVSRSAARVLASGGLFAFTTETHADDGVVLGESLRFAHGEDHVQAAVEKAGLKLLLLDAAFTRTEKQRPVPGLIAVAAQSG